MENQVEYGYIANIVLLFLFIAAFIKLSYKGYLIIKGFIDRRFNKKQMTTDAIQQSLNNINQSMTILVEDVSKIKRGLYGDPDNKVLGLIQRQEKDEERIGILENKIENGNTKKLGIVAGAVLVVVEGWHQLKDYALTLFK